MTYNVGLSDMDRHYTSSIGAHSGDLKKKSTIQGHKKHIQNVKIS